MSQPTLSRREFLRLAGTAAAGATLAACASAPPATAPTAAAPVASGPSPTPQPPAPTTAPTSAPAGKVTIWGWTSEIMRSRNEQGKDVMVQRVKDETGVDIEITLYQYTEYPAALKTALPAGMGPDICGCDWDTLGPYWSFMAPLNEFGQARWGANWQEATFVPSALDEMKMVASIVDKPGEAMFIPGNMQLLGWPFYWIDDFKKHGIDLKTATSFDQFEAACTTLKKAGLEPLAGSKHPATLIDWFQSVAEVTAPGKAEKVQRGEGKFTDPDMVEAFKLHAKVHNEYMPKGLMGMDAFVLEDAFLRHELVMNNIFCGTPMFGFLNSDNQQIKDAMNNGLGTFQLPGTPGLAAVGTGMAIVQNSRLKQEAWKVVEWACVGNGAKYNARDTGQPMAAKAVIPAPRGTGFDQNIGEPLYRALATGKNKFRRILCTDVYQALSDTLPGVITGQITAEVAAAEVQTALERRCAKWLKS